MITAADIERARSVPIQDEVARRGIKLRRSGAELIGPCPACGGDDRFAINIRKQVFNCRGCGAKGDVIDLVCFLDGCGFGAAKATLLGDSVRATNNTAKPKSHSDDDQNLERADQIWRASSALGPEAITYFAERRIDINAAPDHGGLRFHPHCPWGNGSTPAIIGRFTTAISNQPRGIWRRPLTGEKPMTLGPMAGCGIRLWPDHAVEYGLVIGEGVETVLAAATRIHHKGTLLQPAWAMGGTGNLKNFPALSGIEALTILVDHDANRAGQKAAADCAARWSTAGRDVFKLTPKAEGADFNDVIRGLGDE